MVSDYEQPPLSFADERAASLERQRVRFEAIIAPIRARLTDERAAAEWWSDMQRARGAKAFTVHECEVCGDDFQQMRVGRPAKRCPACREIPKRPAPTPRVLLSPEERRAREAEGRRRYRERTREQNRELLREQSRRRYEAMTPAQKKRRQQRARERYHERKGNALPGEQQQSARQSEAA